MCCCQTCRLFLSLGENVQKLGVLQFLTRWSSGRCVSVTWCEHSSSVGPHPSGPHQPGCVRARARVRSAVTSSTLFLLSLTHLHLLFVSTSPSVQRGFHDSDDIMMDTSQLISSASDPLFDTNMLKPEVFYLESTDRGSDEGGASCRRVVTAFRVNLLSVHSFRPTETKPFTTRNETNVLKFYPPHCAEN